MNNTDIAKMIGKTRQMLEATISGKRNFGYKVAVKASRAIGGTPDVWQDSEFASVRKALVEKLKQEKIKGGLK